MGNSFAWLSVCFTAGAVGALVSSVLLWMAGVYGWTAALHVAWTPEWTVAWLYPRLVRGGLWGLLFVPGWLSESFFWRAVAVSLAPTFYELLVVFPGQSGAGLWGLELGAMTPAVAFLANIVWGLAAVFWLRLSGEPRRADYGRLH